MYSIHQKQYGLSFPEEKSNISRYFIRMYYCAQLLDVPLTLWGKHSLYPLLFGLFCATYLWHVNLKTNLDLFPGRALVLAPRSRSTQPTLPSSWELGLWSDLYRFSSELGFRQPHFQFAGSSFQFARSSRVAWPSCQQPPQLRSFSSCLP